MKKIMVLISILLAILVSACASPAATATQAPTQPVIIETPTQSVTTESPATEAPTQPAATEAPTTSPSTNEINIDLADNTIDASTTTFQVGVPYTFVIKNSGQHAHNFNINPPVSVAGSLQGALDSALLVVPQDQLAPGQSATVQFTFPDSAAGQLLEFSCLIRNHYEDGMHVDITVSQ